MSAAEREREREWNIVTVFVCVCVSSPGGEGVVPTLLVLERDLEPSELDSVSV